MAMRHAVIRPASLSDVPESYRREHVSAGPWVNYTVPRNFYLQSLYDAEWRLRGFAKSP